MGKVFEWIQIDKLSLNITKRQFMFFHGRRYVDYVPNILINDCPVSKTDCMKFLSIMVDQHLNWRAHIDYISKTVVSCQLVSYIRYKIILIKRLPRVCITPWYTHIVYTVMKCGASHMHLTEIAYSCCKKDLWGSYAILLPKLCILVLYSLTLVYWN